MGAGPALGAGDSDAWLWGLRDWRLALEFGVWSLEYWSIEFELEERERGQLGKRTSRQVDG